MIGAWATYLGLAGLRFLVQTNSDPGAANAFTILGLSVAGLSVLVLAWTFFQSKNRMQRLWVTLVLWLCAMLMIYVFRGAIV